MLRAIELWREDVKYRAIERNKSGSGIIHASRRTEQLD